MTQMSCLEEYAALGFDGAELLGMHFPSREKDYLVELKKKCADLFLTIAMVSADGHLTYEDDERRQREIEEIGEWVKAGRFLGAPLVRFFVGRGDELTAGGPKLYAKVVKAMKKVTAMGAKSGIVMAVENHGGVDPDQLLSLHRDVNSPYLKLTLDTGNFPPFGGVGPTTYTGIARCAPLAAIVHAKLRNIKEDGSDAVFDWVRIHGILEQAGFRGFVSAEYGGQDDDEPAVLRRMAKFLKATCR
jgi:sugar phosphate isomerase/epimerase